MNMIMDLLIPSPQSILIISFNIFRILCRKYGVYLLFGFIILVLQALSGYYIMQYEIHEKFNRDAGRETKSSSHSFTNLNNIGLAGLTVSYSDSSLKKVSCSLRIISYN